MKTEIDFAKTINLESEAYDLMTAPVNGDHEDPCCLHFTFPDLRTSVLYLKSANGIGVEILSSDEERENLRGFGEFGVKEFPLGSRLCFARILSIVIEGEHERRKLANIRELRLRSLELVKQSKDF